MHHSAERLDNPEIDSRRYFGWKRFANRFRQAKVLADLIRVAHQL
jgi:hypothetical protein